MFSLTGEHRRSITGDWKPSGPHRFASLRGPPVYLCCEVGESVYSRRAMNVCQGRQIFVLSLQGDVLQVYTHPVEGQSFCKSLCYFDGKLLARVVDTQSMTCVEVMAA